MSNNEPEKSNSIYAILGIILFIVWSIGGAYDVPETINAGRLWHLLLFGAIILFGAFVVNNSRYDYFNDGEEDDDHIEFGGR